MDWKPDLGRREGPPSLALPQATLHYPSGVEM